MKPGESFVANTTHLQEITKARVIEGESLNSFNPIYNFQQMI